MNGAGSGANVQATNDALHSVLGKAHKPTQRPLDVFMGEPTPWLDRDHYGPARTLEVDVKSALSMCRVPGEPWSLNPYTGCSHGCLYCYVPTVAHLERARWGSYVVVKRNLPTVLARELARKERREVFLSSATDPYQPAERDQFITRRCLELLARADWPLSVLTRSPLVTRDVDLFRRFSEFEIGMSVPTLDDEARTIVEPTAPTIDSRMRTLRKLADEGFRPYANILPTYPLTGGVTPAYMAESFRDAGVVAVHAGPWNYLASVLPVLRDRIKGTMLEPFGGQVLDSGYWNRLLAKMSTAFDQVGVRFESMHTEPAWGSPFKRPSTAG